MSEYEHVCQQIANVRKLLVVAQATKRGVCRLLDELDQLIDRKRHIESFRTIPESHYAKQR